MSLSIFWDWGGCRAGGGRGKGPGDIQQAGSRFLDSEIRR